MGRAIRNLTSVSQALHETSSTTTTTNKEKNNLTDLYQSLGKQLIKNKQNQLNFNWFDTDFYLSPWWDQVYNFGWHFLREQNPWCQHLYFRKTICDRLGSNRLFES